VLGYDRPEEGEDSSTPLRLQCLASAYQQFYLFAIRCATIISSTFWIPGSKQLVGRLASVWQQCHRRRALGVGSLVHRLRPGSCFRGLQDSIINYRHNRQPEIVACLREDHAIAIAHAFTKVLPTSPVAAAVSDGTGLMNVFMTIDNARLDRVRFPILEGKGHLDSTRRN